MLNCIRRLLITGLATLALAACGTPAPAQQSAKADFAQMPPLGLAVSAIDIASTYQPSAQPPHVETQLPVLLDGEIKRWAQVRLVARGGAEAARFTITEASVVAVALDRDAGLPGLVRTPQTTRYDAVVAGMLVVLDAGGGTRAFASARTQVSTTLGKDLSDAFRRQRLADVVDQAAAAFNVEMEKSIRANLAANLTR